MSGDKKDYEIVNSDIEEFFDDEFGVYYDGEFYEEVEEEPAAIKSSAAGGDNNAELLREIARLREEIRRAAFENRPAPAPAQAPVQVVVPAPAQAAAPAPVAPAAPAARSFTPDLPDGYQLKQEFDSLKAYVKRGGIPLPEKINKMLEFNRTVSRIPYGRYDELVSAFETLKTWFLSQRLSNESAEEVISFKGYIYDILTEEEEDKARDFMLFRELYSPGDEFDYYEIAGRLTESKNWLQNYERIKENEDLYNRILILNAELLERGSYAGPETKARLAPLFDELLALALSDIIDFPDVIRPGIKTAAPAAPAGSAPREPAQGVLKEELALMKEEIERLKATEKEEELANNALLAEVANLLENQNTAPQKAPPFPPRAAKPADAQAGPPKPDNIRKAHSLARVIANRMILDNILNELDEQDLTREKRDKIIKKLVPGASRLDDQPKELQKLANTLVADKLETMNKKYERMQKQRDREIKKAAREAAARERAERAAQKQSFEEARKAAAAAADNIGKR